MEEGDSLLYLLSYAQVDSVEDLVSGKTGSGWGVEDGSLMQQIGRAAPAGSAFAKMHAGATYGGTCYDFKEEIKAGEVPGSVCERVTIQKVLSDDFTETGKCNFYVASKDFLATSFAMAFQVLRHFRMDVLHLVKQKIFRR